MATEQTQSLLDDLAAGVAAIKTSDDWRAWLETAAKFYRYSFGNQILIACQKPEATYVAGFHKWLELNRHVRKGEHGLRILAPCVYKRTAEDPDTGEETTSRQVTGFRGAVVFDVSQTDGEDLPEVPAHKLTGAGDPEIVAALVGFAKANGAPSVDLEAELAETRNGETSTLTREIRVSRTLSGEMRIKTLAHEIGHLLLHCDPKDSAADREQAELEAESVAWLTCRELGLDSSSYSFGYVASWTGQHDAAKALQTSGQRILKTARAITDALAA